MSIQSQVLGEDESGPVEVQGCSYGLELSDVTSMVWMSDVVGPAHDPTKELREMAEDYAKWASLHRTIIWCVGMVVGAVTLVQVLGMFVHRCTGGG